MNNYNACYYSETKKIKRLSKALADERLAFMDGKRLGDLDIAIEGGPTLRKVRRIIEKRVNQNYWKSGYAMDITNYSRHTTRRHLTNQIKSMVMFQQDSCFIVQRSTSEIITEDETHSVIAEW